MDTVPPVLAGDEGADVRSRTVHLVAGVAALTLILAACGSANKQTTITVTQTNGGSAGSPTTSATGSTGSGGATNSSSGSSDASLQVAAAGYYEYTSFGDRQMDYYALIKKQFMPMQQSNGSWSRGYDGQSPGPVYQTAIAVLALSVPADYLPIFQR